MIQTIMQRVWVRHATYWCPELKADDPAKKGICSNFLCDTEPGTWYPQAGNPRWGVPNQVPKLR